MVGLTAGGTAAFYTFTTYMQTFVKLSVGLTEDQTTLVIFGSLVFATLLQPVYGALSDRIGRKPLLIFFGVVGTLSTIPILTALKETKSPLTAFLLLPPKSTPAPTLSPYPALVGCVVGHRAGDRAVFQESRARGLVLHLPYRRHLSLADHLRHHARHQA